MATLVSPGVSISVVDQSINVGAGPGTVPLIVIATAANKPDPTDPTGATIAPGTKAANNGVLWNITSQRDLVQTFGNPTFYNVSGTPLNAYPLNEYGLISAYSYLGISNLAQVIRANIDLGQLQPSIVPPSSPASIGTLWFNESSPPTGSIYGLFVKSSGNWVPVTISYFWNGTLTSPGTPNSGDGVNGQYGITFDSTSGTIAYYLKSSGAWSQVTSIVMQDVWPDVPTTTQNYWLKTSSGSQGANIVLDIMDATVNNFIQVEAPILPNDAAAVTYYANEPHGILGQYYIEPVATPGVTATGTAVITSNAVTSVTITNGGTDYVTPPTVSFSGGGGTGATATAVLTSGVVTSVTITGGGTGYTSAPTVAFSAPPTPAPTSLQFRKGIVTNPSTNPPTYGFVPATGIIGSTTAPVNGPAVGQLWYNSWVGIYSNGQSAVDIMYNNGQDSWENINLPGFSIGLSGAPTLYPQSQDPRSNVPTVTLNTGDLWLVTDDVTDYPVLNKWSGTAWVLVNNTDEVTPNGIIFKDARPIPGYQANGTSNQGQNNGGGSAPDLDPDAPDAALYPKGFLLWNTRYSSNNVKNWINPFVFDGITASPYLGSTGRWVTLSGNRPDGSPFMGSDAQQAVVADAINEVIASNQSIRAEDIFFNLIAAPGYVEAISSMVALNTDRQDTAFVVGDSPMTLNPSGTSLQAWSSNSSTATDNGNKGLVTASRFLGVWYPSGITTNPTDGTDVVVPPSYMALYTLAYNDQVAYPWFAPAGLQRGVVQNAASVGYVDAATGQFFTVPLNNGQRDILYTNGVNPIRIMPGGGVVIYGQIDRQGFSSALDRINVVRLENYLRYQLNLLAQPFLFEPNDTITRNAVLNAFNNFLSELITLRALYDFLVVCDTSNNTPARIDANQLWIDIAIQPVKAIEYIYIPIRITNTGASLTAGTTSAS